MLALMQLFNITPAAGFYYSILGGRKRGIFAREKEEVIIGSGDVYSTESAFFEEIEEIVEKNKNFVIEYIRRIRDGDIEIKPYDKKVCRDCLYKPICRT